MMNTGSATNRWPAARSVSTNGVQLVVPRRISTGLSHAVVTCADSMKSVNGGEYMPSTKSGPIHHADTNTAPSVNRAASRKRRSATSSTNAGRHAAMVAVALTAPMHATATTAGATWGRRCTSGTNVHGTSATGQASEEIAVSVVKILGLSAYSNAAHTGGHVPVIPMRRASTNVPEYATPSNNAHHARCVNQSGNHPNNQKNAPCGNRYPYAWFCTWPSGNSSVYACVARAKNRAGLATRSNLVSAATCPGGCASASRVRTSHPRTWALLDDPTQPYFREPYSGPPSTASSAETAVFSGTVDWPDAAAIPSTPTTPSTMPTTALATTGDAAWRFSGSGRSTVWDMSEKATSSE